LAIQAIVTIVSAFATWRAVTLVSVLPARTPAAPAMEPAVTSATPLLLRSPSLDLRPGTTLRGAPVLLQGDAPLGEVVAIVIDGRVVASGLAAGGRFAV